MKRILLLLALCLLVGAPASWAANRSGSVSMQFDLSAHPVNAAVRLWIPYPVSDRYQTISDIQWQGNYTSAAVTTDNLNGTPALYVEWPKGTKQRNIKLRFSVDRQEIRRGTLPAEEPAWNVADYAEYLAPTKLGPIDGAVQELSSKIVKGQVTTLTKAKAIYDWTIENMYRDPQTRGCGIGDVCALLLKPGGKCTDISSVYVALCRAAGVPAREVFGLRLGKTAQQDISSWQHCWAEVFIPGAGWIPADPADVRKAMLVSDLKINSPAVQELRDYFWGGIDAYRFKLAVGRDLILNPVQAGPALNTFGYPYAEVDGKPLDFYDPKNFCYSFTFQKP
jgi:transglutaminase-like putative cysteine protease